MEDRRKDILDAIEARDGRKLSASIYSYVSFASNISIDELAMCPWWEIARAYRAIYMINTPGIDFPFIRKRKSLKAYEEIVSWDYSGRSFYVWANMIASEYGWSLEYIGQLEIDDALGLLQEMLVSDQLRKEWEWSLTEIAYPFDANTKKSQFSPLKRPEWMEVAKKYKEPQITRISKSELPVGLTYRWEDDKPQ